MFGSFSLRLLASRVLARVLPLVLAGLVAGPAGGGALQAPDSMAVWRPGAEAEAEVRRALAQRWAVVPEALVLEWGRPRGGTVPDHFRQIELIGHGRDGRWVVSFRETSAARDGISVLLRAGVVVQRPVASRTLQRGEVLAEEDLTMEPMTNWGPLTDLPEAGEIGWVAQRQIRVGEALAEPGVKPPLLVISGGPIQAHWSNGRVELNLQATAMGSGVLGERVFIRTEEGTRLDAIVRGPGLVEISNSWMESGK